MDGLDLTPILQAILGLASVALVAILNSAAAVLKQRWGVDIDTSKEGTLNRAIDRGIDFVRTQALGADGKLMIDASHMPIMVKWAADYVIDKVPDTLEHFGIDEGKIEEMISARFRDLFPEAADVMKPTPPRASRAMPPMATSYPLPPEMPPVTG
jgi:hypothetical protein